MFRPRQTSTALLAVGLGLLVAAQIVPAFLATPSASKLPAKAPTTAQRSARQSDYGRLPISFEPNMGQASASTRFLTRGSGYTLAVSETGATLALAIAQPAATASRQFPGLSSFPGVPVWLDANVTTSPPATVSMAWLGANPHPLLTGENPLPGIVNYFLGNDPAQWHTNIPTYQQVRLHDVYPGVDLVYYGTSDQLEYDFVVAPGADPSRITLGFTGAQRLGVDLAGNLALSLPDGVVQQDHPAIYQTVNGARRAIPGGYALGGHGRVGFALGAYDPHLPLVVDPAYKFSTYLGGSGDDFGGGIALDAGGNVYITGDTASINFPTQNPLQVSLDGISDVSVTKLNAAGTALIYSTYLGGSSGEGGSGIAVDSHGNAYVVGTTTSSDFPTVGPVQSTFGGTQDAFVSKLNANGSMLVYSTYLGGPSLESGNGIAVDTSGNAYVVGTTGSSNFPTHNPLQATLGGNFDAFVSKLNPGGSAFAYSTYLGGSGYDFGNAIALDSSDDVYITGKTNSTDFPTHNPLQSTNSGSTVAFVSELNAAGTALVYSTYLGGTNSDIGQGIAVDAIGNAYVTGSTTSSDFPTHNPLQATYGGGGDAFVSKLSASGSSLVYSTYLGGSNIDQGNSIAVDAKGVAYVTGYTYSLDFALVNPLQNSEHSSFGNAFISRINAAGSAVLFSTYLGGSGSMGDSGDSIAVGAGGNIYVSGTASSSDFPIANALYPTFGGGNDDAFVTKIETLPSVDTTTGVFRPSNGVLYLKNANTTGPADISLNYGLPGDQPITGDWTGKGYKSIGIYRNGTFYLRNTNTTGFADITAAFGASGDIPVAGDWTGKGYDSVGVYRPATSTFYLRDTNTSGPPDHVVTLGISGDVPIVGDWTAKGWDSVGVFRPSNGIVYLRNSNTTGFADSNFVYGIAGDKPVVGDWDHNGTDTIGVDRNGNFLLRNSNTTGPANLSFYLGVSGDDPIAGPWLAPVGGLPAHP